MTTPQLGVIGIVVADMARSLAFYRQLGLAVPPEADAAPHVEAALPGGLQLVWDSVDNIRSFDPDSVAASGSAGMFLAFKLDSPAAVDATYDQLVAAGYNGHLAPWDAFWGERYARIHDPDGNSVDLFADPATNEETATCSSR
jgi:catechol 2,3-dioxygenase-like lactoylglutathione lyase family enzyme